MRGKRHCTARAREIRAATGAAIARIEKHCKNEPDQPSVTQGTS